MPGTRSRPIEGQPLDEFGALRDERDALLAIIDHSPEVSLMYLDADFNFLFVNATYAAGCGIPAEDLIGRNHFDLFPNEDNERIFKHARDSGDPVSYREKPFVFESDTGRGVTYWDWTLSPVKDPSGKVRSLVCSLVDVTDRVTRGRLAVALGELDATLHAAHDVEEIIRRVIVESAEAVGCDSVGVALRDGGEWIGYFVGEPLQHLHGRRFSDDEVPVATLAAKRKEPVHVDDVEQDAAVRDKLRVFGLKSVLNVPLIVRDEVIGVLGFDYHTVPVPFTAPVIEFGVRVAASLSLAIANAQALESERRRARLEDALNRMLTVFVTARTPDAVLREVVEESVRACGADYSILSFVEDGEWVVRYSVGEGGNGRVPYRYPYEERPVLVDVSRDMNIALVPDAMADARTNKSIMREFAIKAFAALPLQIRGEFVGVIELVYTKSRVVFSPEVTDFLERLVSTVSVALEQAREFERDHRVAETLQEAMLIMPASVAGIEFAHAYHSASDATRVGGDFFDVFDLDNGLVGLTMGDISGKGLDAAAYTSLVKNTIRANATQKGTTAADAVALADRVLFRGSDPEMFATIIFAMLDRRDGRLVYCNAGHPSAAIVRQDGSVARLGVTSPIVGALPGIAFRNAESRLEAGDVLLLYTDGLTEARRSGELFGEERLFEALSTMGGLTPSEVLTRLRETVLAFGGPRLADDLALLAVRRADAGGTGPTQMKLDTG